MLILCHRDALWYLAGFSENPRWAGQFSISVSTAMPRDSSRCWKPLNNYLCAVLDRTEESLFTFYPQVRYHGMRLHVVGWKRDTTEPILHVWSVWEPKRFTDEAWNRLVEQRLREGWKWDRDHGSGFVHVDKLEKIEGPPPDGAF